MSQPASGDVVRDIRPGHQVLEKDPILHKKMRESQLAILVSESKLSSPCIVDDVAHRNCA
jgi:hypothetical protein